MKQISLIFVLIVLLNQQYLIKACYNIAGINVVYDPRCSIERIHGCNAGNQGINCRFCGSFPWQSCSAGHHGPIPRYNNNHKPPNHGSHHGFGGNHGNGHIPYGHGHRNNHHPNYNNHHGNPNYNNHHGSPNYNNHHSYGSHHGFNHHYNCFSHGAQRVIYDHRCSTGQISYGCGANGQQNCRFCGYGYHSC